MNAFLFIPAAVNDAEVLAALHQRCFDLPWSAEDMRGLLASPGVTAILGGAGPASPPFGFIMMRVASDEAEVLSICVLPEARGRGAGYALLEAGLAEVSGAGGKSVFLEVAADNDSAKALYSRAGFRPAGARKGYYARAAGPAMDAILMKLTLTPA